MRQVVRKLCVRVSMSCYDRALLQTFEGIRICDTLSVSEARREAFRADVLEALTLVKTHDMRRFRRIQRNLPYIVNDRCEGMASYRHSLRICAVDFGKLRLARIRYRRVWDGEWGRLKMARSIVHEATHGEIFAWGVPYDRENYLRVERLCHREEARFVRRVRPGTELPPYDGTWHREHYQARERRGILSFARRLRGADEAGLYP